MTLFYPGIAGKRPGKPTFVIIHNDAGSINACASYYRNWLPNHEAELGFAHVYIAKDGKYQADDFDNIAWHSGNSFANEWALSWEVCQSMGATDLEFEAVEEAVFKDVAAAMTKYGLTPNRETVRLHKEYTATDCPHRSWALHGSAINAVQDYFIEGIKKYMGSTNNNEPVAPIQPNNEGEIEMVLLKVTDKNSKMDGSVWNFNGETMVRLDGVTAGHQASFLKTVDINQAQMSHYKDNGVKTIGDFKY
ncbi:peptidoglycan recognition protein family protein [Lactococcus lactis]|uniref:peptidoglycan recognition protein family protein n=1 Tax=Lactococcus lactis TaxID=1358 RepID=UPI001C55736C|nr:N-acetylmuramoyl-L-alanine amidase [Lactococcus lactis]GFO80049.1 hypothetical protein LL1119B1_21050 [Lactococcus lactis]